MSAAFVLVLVVAGGYLAAHVAFEWLGRRHLIVSGAEYLLLGILVGPEVSGLIRPDVVGEFAPFMTLALGWVGAMVGVQFYLPALMRIPGRFFQVALIEAVASFALVAGAMAVVLSSVFPITMVEAALPSIALGAIAAASAPSGIGLVSRRGGRRAAVLRQLEVATAVEAAVAVVAFGLLLSIAHPPLVLAVRTPSATEWAVITVGIGVVAGALFHLFLGGERHPDRLFIALAGAIILASGAAAYLELSPLLPAMLIGAILVNTSGNRDEIRVVLGKVERPLYFVLLIFAGAAWRWGDEPWLLPVVVFLGVRLLAKLAGGWLGAAAGGALGTIGGGWGRALLGQGGLAIAIALNYRILHDAPFADVVFTAAILSVLLHDLTSARLVRTVVRPPPAAVPPASNAGAGEA